MKGYFIGFFLASEEQPGTTHQLLPLFNIQRP